MAAKCEVPSFAGKSVIVSGYCKLMQIMEAFGTTLGYFFELHSLTRCFGIFFKGSFCGTLRGSEV